MTEPRSVLAINGGSSTVKFALFTLGALPVREFGGVVQRVGAADAELRTSAPAAGSARHPFPAPDPGQAITHVLAQLAADNRLAGVAAVAHRVAHGGPYTGPVVVTPDALKTLDALVPFAPLHQPHNLAGVRAATDALPGVPHVACFDTAFHASMSRAERAFGLPRRYFEDGVRRYGFHGLAYESVVNRLRALAPADAAGRVIACHLGSGASLCALRDGRSVATTMGLTPLDGLLMSTRVGAIDPGVIVYLARRDGLTPDGLERLLGHESGLLGASGGISRDMRELLASPAPAAAEAVELFCHRVVREVGGMAAALEGVDAIAFSGGIGENAPAVRERVCRRLGWLGATLDPTANTANAELLSEPGSRVRVYRVAVDEEAVLARAARGVLERSGPNRVPEVFPNKLGRT